MNSEVEFRFTGEVPSDVQVGDELVATVRVTVHSLEVELVDVSTHVMTQYTAGGPVRVGVYANAVKLERPS